MPIEVQSEIKVFDQEEYHALNRRFLGIVFDVHKDFGRFLELAKREIAERCAEIGITPVEREVRIRVTHGPFMKNYFMDLLLGSGLMIEAKAAEAIAPAHRAQALNYLLLSGMQHGTLVNLRPERVEHEFVSTKLIPERRRQFTVVDAEWQKVNSESTRLKQTIVELLHDWGAFLELALYREAVTCLLGGAAVVERPIEIFSGVRSLGTQTAHLLSPDTCFAFSAVTERAESFGLHLNRLLCHTRLRHLQWINLNHHLIEFRTLSNRPHAFASSSFCQI